MIPIAYVCAPLSAKSFDKRRENIAAADNVARELERLGYAVYCPHNAMGHWWGNVSEAHAMACCLRFVEVSQVLCVSGDWRNSKGCEREIVFARENGIPVYFGAENVPVASEYQPDGNALAIQTQLEQRRKGVARYGQPLKPFNGRDSLQDAIEEVADLAAYLHNAKAER